ncbi:hypothetical protein SKAU_G00255830 [Synaphobranchus kaupii]|uniref:Uncharacterized protein n=1 Tax=Synaphobranchus kaupii TaxID=118154 RepID=A0A9Q1IS24_SYNKA|nr:hypothetical protein SKAU_G00255830 [Synaphobranchus kaupii]
MQPNTVTSPFGYETKHGPVPLWVRNRVGFQSGTGRDHVGLQSGTSKLLFFGTLATAGAVTDASSSPSAWPAVLFDLEAEEYSYAKSPGNMADL